MLMETRELCKTYGAGRSAVGAVKGAGLSVDRGETIGLWGPSGSGKSTLGMMLAGLLRPTSGRILWKGEEIAMPYPRRTRRGVQILFQHPEVSFNPVLPLRRSLREPYDLRGLKADDDTLSAGLARYGLRREHLDRLPVQMSGGELQRAALMRILVLEPELIVLDEPTSMLDVITQAQIFSLLTDWQRVHGTAYVLISHDEALVRRFCGRIYDVCGGEVKEEKS